MTSEHASHAEYRLTSRALIAHAIRGAMRGPQRAVCLIGMFTVGVAAGVEAAPALFPPIIELSSLDGTNGFVLTGIRPGDRSGYSASDAGDVNGDGIDDLLIGACTASPGGRTSAGESYVVFGRTTDFPAAFELRSLHPAAGGDGSAGFILRGIDAYDSAARAVSGAGDVNGDTIDDLLIAASDADPGGRYRAGETYVVFGRATAFPAALELRSLLPAAGGDGSSGLVLRGIDAYDEAGVSVSGAGDVNGDGVDDLLIGALADPRGESLAGESYVVFGRTTGYPAAFELRSLLPAAGGDGSSGFVLRGIDAYDWAGRAVSVAGDVNGDGIDDLIIAAPYADPGGRIFAGESYVVFGRATGFPPTFELGSLEPTHGGDGSAGFILEGIDFNDRSGRSSVSGAGDVNGDGIDDVLIGASHAGSLYSGESYVVFGRTTGFPAVFELSRLDPAFGGDGSKGFILRGIRGLDRSGGSVSDAGDINGDGIDDLLIGAYTAAHSGGEGSNGETYVVFGRTTGFPAIFALRGLDPAFGGDGSAGFIMRGVDPGDASGWAVSRAGDVNSDGVDDLLIGAPHADPTGSSSGESYVVFGRAGPAGERHR